MNNSEKSAFFLQNCGGLFFKRMFIFRVFGSFDFSTKEPFQSCFVCHRHWHHPVSVLASALLSVHTSPWHMVRHRNSILDTLAHMSPIYGHQIFNDSDL